MKQRWVVAAWLAGVVLCAAIIARTDFVSDLSAFLPRAPTPSQQVLVDQLRHGVVSRLILIGIEGAQPAQLAAVSKRMAAQLRENEQFASIANGEDAGLEKDREFLWRNRYLLSPAIAPTHFSPASIRASLEENLQLLSSPVGILLQRVLPADPTGEILRLAETLEGGARPPMRDGVWFSAQGTRALMIAQTRAPGYDIDAQAHALASIRAAFSEATAAGITSQPKLLITGPGVFSVSTRDRIQSDAVKLSLAASILVGVLMFIVYRSVTVLTLGLLPVASGALAGVAAVSAGFGSVHGITLGFGATLIGEGADYAVYLFTQTERGRARDALDRLWPTLRLGVLTSICGFSAMLFSGFTGLAQLGLFSIAGLAAALLVTRWVLPAFTPAGFNVEAVSVLGPWAMRLMNALARLRLIAVLLVALAAAFLILRDSPAWSDELASLSPVPITDQQLDEALRRDMGAPDVRHLIVLRAANPQGALERAENVAEVLQRLVSAGALDGFDTPATYLPSVTVQRARQTSLPEPGTLRQNLREAAQGLPFQDGLFEPFLRDVDVARAQPLIDHDTLRGTRLALKVDALL
ncbi:MAG: MMPL family transporter, partial [Pseudomonadota bacterium]